MSKQLHDKIRGNNLPKKPTNNQREGSDKNKKLWFAELRHQRVYLHTREVCRESARPGSRFIEESSHWRHVSSGMQILFPGRKNDVIGRWTCYPLLSKIDDRRPTKRRTVVRRENWRKPGSATKDASPRSTEPRFHIQPERKLSSRSDGSLVD